MTTDTARSVIAGRLDRPLTASAGISSEATTPRPTPGSEPYLEDNLLDRLSRPETLESHYRHLEQREQAILRSRLPLVGGEVLSVGAGWHPGRHLFPAPAFRIHAVDADAERVAGVLREGRADSAEVAHAGRLGATPESFDVVLYRLVLHHLVYQGPLEPIFAEAARLLKPGGAMIAVEPGLWHPVGAALAVANRLKLGEPIHGTRDDIPLSPRMLVSLARGAGLVPELHSVTFAWRRLPPAVAAPLHRLDSAGSRPRLARFGHTLLLIARRPRR